MEKPMLPELPKAEIERLEQYSVWLERQRHSDKDLWNRLNELANELTTIKAQITEAYEKGHSERKDCMQWRERWQSKLNHINATKHLMRGYVWHLVKREDTDIHSWIGRNNDPFFSWYP